MQYSGKKAADARSRQLVGTQVKIEFVKELNEEKPSEN